MIMWFKENWLPNFRQSQGVVGIAAQSQAKIDIQTESVKGQTKKMA